MGLAENRQPYDMGTTRRPALRGAGVGLLVGLGLLILLAPVGLIVAVQTEWAGALWISIAGFWAVLIAPVVGAFIGLFRSEW